VHSNFLASSVLSSDYQGLIPDVARYNGTSRDWLQQQRVQFLPRDAYAYRGLCRGKISVHRSVTRRYCV